MKKPANRPGTDLQRREEHSVTVLLIFLFVVLYFLSERTQAQDLVRLVEGATVFLFGYAVVASLLSLVSFYHHILTVSLLLAFQGVRLIAKRDGRALPLPRIPRVSPEYVSLLVIATLYLIAAWSRSEWIEMSGDAGVYCNMAQNMARTGGTRYTFDTFDEVDESFSQILQYNASLPGIYRTDDSKAYYQFLPGWPSILALGIEIFGDIQYSAIMLAMGLLIIFWTHQILRQWLHGWRLAAAVAAFALNPLVIYFSKYTTSELFLLLAVLFISYVAMRTPQRQGATLLPMAAISLTHISLFLYIPILFLYGAYVLYFRRREMSTHLMLISFIFALSLGVNYFQSPLYYTDIFLFAFGSYLDVEFYVFPIIIGLCTLLPCVGAIAWLRRQNAASRKVPVPRWVEVGLRSWMLIVLGYTVWIGYRLGWTDDLKQDSWTLGAWSRRVQYANQGVESLLHLNLFSIMLATGVVLLPVLIGILILPRIRLLEDDVDLFFSFGFLSTLSIYTFIRPDTPINFYASRYFLPLLVPFAVFLTLKKIARSHVAGFLACLLPVLVFNLFYVVFFATSPVYQGRHRLANELRKMIPENAVVFSLGDDPYVHHLFANMIHYNTTARYGYLKELSVLGFLPQAIERLDADAIFLISDQPLWQQQAEIEERVLTLRDRPYVYWHNIMYPIRTYPVVRRFYVYLLHGFPEHRLFDLSEEDFFIDRVLTTQELALLSPESYWGKVAVPVGGFSTGIFSIRCPESIRTRRILFETGGNLLRYLGPSDLVVEIDGQEFVLRLKARRVSVQLPVQAAVHQLNVRSATFVPQELGINDDPRHLGIDLVRIVFE